MVLMVLLLVDLCRLSFYRLLLFCVLCFIISHSVLAHYESCSEKLLCSFFFSFIYFYLFLAALGLGCCAWAFSSFGERGLLFIAVHGLLIAMASLVTEHRL